MASWRLPELGKGCPEQPCGAAAVVVGGMAGVAGICSHIGICVEQRPGGRGEVQIRKGVGAGAPVGKWVDHTGGGTGSGWIVACQAERTTGRVLDEEVQRDGVSVLHVGRVAGHALHIAANKLDRARDIGGGMGCGDGGGEVDGVLKRGNHAEGVGGLQAGLRIGAEQVLGGHGTRHGYLTGDNGGADSNAAIMATETVIGGAPDGGLVGFVLLSGAVVGRVVGLYGQLLVPQAHVEGGVWGVTEETGGGAGDNR